MQSRPCKPEQSGVAGWFPQGQPAEKESGAASWLGSQGRLAEEGSTSGKVKLHQLLQYKRLSKSLSLPQGLEIIVILPYLMVAKSWPCYVLEEWISEFKKPLCLLRWTLCCRNSSGVFSSFLCKQGVYKLQALLIPLLSLMHSWAVQSQRAVLRKLWITFNFFCREEKQQRTKSFSYQLHCQKAFTTTEVSLSNCWGCQIIQSPKRKEDMLQIMVWELSATTTVKEKQYLNSLSRAQ